jgi:hypothetical protein
MRRWISIPNRTTLPSLPKFSQEAKWFITPNLEFLKADIRSEIEKLAALEAEFDRITDKLRLPESAVPFYDRGAIGYLLHCFYNGCGFALD